ncbi:MAG: dihydrolipoamide acetyltransferase family protein [Pseudomonadota bacterium]
MPQLGETVDEGTVGPWRKKEGDSVAADEVLLEVETDKVSMEIPAPKAGRLSQILVQSGETVSVGTVLAVIQGAGENATEPKSDDDKSAKPAAASEPRKSATVTLHPAALGVSGVSMPAATADGRKLSPAVRRLVAEHNLDVERINGTGRNGRIKLADVREVIAASGSAASPPATRSVVAPAPPADQAQSANSIPFNRVRKLTAEHMVASKATSPHVLQAVEVDFSGVERARKSLKESWKAQRGYSLTYLPFIAHSVCIALQEFPNANASVGNDELLLHSTVNLAIAVDLGTDGLVAPVVHGAEKMSLAQLADAFQDLATRARNNRLKADDLSGGTYTLSNSGSFGTLITAPIINQPQVAILSTDGVRKKPIVIEHPDGDTIAIRPVGILAQSFDHRAFDGAYSASFLKRVRTLLEQTNWFREV